VVHEKHKDKTLATLPEGAVVGTSSLRRLAQLRHHYPHLTFKDVRGNVITRLEKLDSGEFDCLILAAAGLGRLGLGDRIHELIDPSISLHAVGQGALGIECREGDATVLEQIKVLEHLPTARRCLAERAFLRELEGGCQVPIGVNTRFEGEGDAAELVLTGMVASLDGQRLIRDEARGPQHDPEPIGIALAHMLKQQGAGEILEEIFASVRPEA
jgi:hydroxymethylbilane synthase